MAVTGRRPAEIFFSASFAPATIKLPFSAVVFSGQLKTRFAPGTSFQPYPIPVLAEPKIVLEAFGRLRAIRTYPSQQRAHIANHSRKNPRKYNYAIYDTTLAKASLRVLERHHLLPPL
jgi:hypothetical protein